MRLHPFETRIKSELVFNEAGIKILINQCQIVITEYLFDNMAVDLFVLFGRHPNFSGLQAACQLWAICPAMKAASAPTPPNSDELNAV
jgi:hypothetical protein